MKLTGEREEQKTSRRQPPLRLMKVEVGYEIIRNDTISVRATVAIVATGEVDGIPNVLSNTKRVDGVVTNYATRVCDDLAEARFWVGDVIEEVAQYYAEYCAKLHRLQREIPDHVLVEIDQHGRWSGEV